MIGNKKGDFALLELVTLIAGIIAAVMVAYLVSRFSSADAINQQFLVRDSAMLADAMLAAPQNVRAIYSSIPFVKGSTGRISGAIWLMGDKLVINPSNDEKKLVPSASFVPRKDVSVVTSRVGGPLFFIIKERGQLYLSPSINYATLSESQGSGGSAGE